MREEYYVPEQKMSEWKRICEAFADKYGCKLLFVNETSCGVELKDGSFKHIYIDEMQEILRKDKTSEGDKNEN